MRVAIASREEYPPGVDVASIIKRAICDPNQDVRDAVYNRASLPDGVRELLLGDPLEDVCKVAGQFPEIQSRQMGPMVLNG